MSFLPYIYGAVSYPLFYEKEIVSGVIEEVSMQKEAVHIRHRSSDMPTYYFKINDTDVRVTPSIAREYKEGDVYNYIQYSVSVLKRRRKRKKKPDGNCRSQKIARPCLQRNYMSCVYHKMFMS